MAGLALTEAARDRLSKLLGMLGSDHAGERDNAGVAANRLVRDAGLTWNSGSVREAAGGAQADCRTDT